MTAASRQDLTRFPAILDTPWDYPRRRRRLRARLGEIVQAATSFPRGEEVLTPIACTRRPRRRPCGGKLAVARGADPEAPIRWRCSRCGEEGEIAAWAGGDWDLSAFPVPGADGSPVRRLILAPAEWKLLRKHLVVLDPDIERLLARGRWTPSGIEVAGSPPEVDDLAGFLRHEAGLTARAERRARLVAMAERIEGERGEG